MILFCVNIEAKIFLDNDLDGVANKDDKCPNSKITDIVDKYGCAVSKVVFKEDKHLDISIGISRDKSSGNWQNSQYLSLSYYYGNSNFSITASKYSSNNSNDLTVAYYYYINNPKYCISLGAGTYIPFDSNDKNDYFLSAKYTYYFYNSVLSAEYKHIFSRDVGTKDSNSLTVEYGYLINKKLFIALSYSLENSIYENKNNIQTIDFYTNYHFNKNWYISGDLQKNVSSSSDISYTVSLGYYF